jgi:alpha-beta hydrolase superfamily lysophospholipase
MTTQQDILGPGYTARTLKLSGGNVATLVRKEAESATRGAVLYLHGYVDYFFQTHLAEFITARGRDFYAIDLRRYGRSLRDGDIPWFTTDLAEYFEELDLAIGKIQLEGHADVIAVGHSTGGLILPLWLHERRHTTPINGLVLNSPWLDLQKDWFTRTIGTRIIDFAGRIQPTMPLPDKLSGVYPASLHEDHYGEWSFNPWWKPLTGVTPLAGWFRTVRRAHARLQDGLDVRFPVLVMRSDKSLLGLSEWTPEAMTADTVLDVAHMEKWAPRIGSHVEVAVVENGLHDLFLSPEPTRQRAFEVLDAWLERHR